MSFIRILAALGVAALLSLGAIACGDDDDEGDGGDATAVRTTAPTRPATTPTVAGTAAASPGATGTAAGTASAGETLTVEARDFSFSPTSLTADQGEPYTIVLENGGSAPHTLTVYEDDAFTTEVAGADTGRISGGATGQFSVTFDEAKTYHFRCEVHNQMQGEITVE